MLFLIPTSCNPLHAGHLNIFHYVTTNYGGKINTGVAFEIADVHVGKSLPPAKDRAFQFHRLQLPFVVTHLDTMYGKAREIQCTDTTVLCSNTSLLEFRLTRKICFCVGVDCFQQIYNPKHYCSFIPEMHRIFKKMSENGVSFLVFERNGVKLSDLTDVPPDLAAISSEAENYKSINISSTELREAKENV